MILKKKLYFLPSLISFRKHQAFNFLDIRIEMEDTVDVNYKKSLNLKVSKT